MALNPGEVIVNRYKIVKKLGEGGFGAVYLAEDLNLRGKQVAIKENYLDPTNPVLARQSAEQFEQEALILAALSHSNLPHVMDYHAPSGGLQFLVMDFIPGESLQTRVVRDGLMTENEALSVILQILDALIYLHNQKPPVIHRDIKPANIIISPVGKAFLVDFGISKTTQTLSGARAASPCYSPPEQYGSGTDPRSDVYAVGATLYFILTGTPPLDSMARLVGDSLQAPLKLNARLSTVTSVAVMKAMHLKPDQRFQSVEELRDTLTTPAPIKPSAPHVVQKPRSKEIVVSAFGKGQFKSIQEAIDACTDDVKLITVKQGTYNEFITISSDVIIIGEGRPSIYSVGDQPVVRVRSGSVSIEGFYLSASIKPNSCIEQSGGKLVVKQCEIHGGSTFTIRVIGGMLNMQSCRIGGLSLTDKLTGLGIYGESKCHIINCFFRSASVSGVTLHEKCRAEFEQSKFISNSKTGVSIYEAIYASFRDCAFETNGEAGLMTIYESETIATKCTFLGNNYGVVTKNTSTPTFIRCQFKNNAKFGALCTDESAPTFEDCVFSDSGIIKKLKANPRRI